ncbi:MAG: beta-ketoacyl synthase N-terminal-like domain-containing protein [SAR324 cluster bacterium]|nr:beta-ketoacyl synthase N-terminal-like domain-containing protein [SAR324 cluster bacterium]
MEKIAVIGISCLFPGASNPEEFFENLLEKKDGTSKATATEMGQDPSLYLGEKKGTPDKTYNVRGGYIRGFEFDASGFKLPEDKLKGLDPVCQWPLHTAREALKDGGYLDNAEALKKTGLILGNLSFPTRSSNQHFIPRYHKKLEELATAALQGGKINFSDAIAENNPDNAWISARPTKIISEALGLKASHLTLDAACASSLYSVKIACDYLLTGKADLMLAGAVSAADPFFVSMGFSTFQAFPEGERSYPLDKNTQGLVYAEGAGFFLLKKLDRAQADGDHIHAVIEGIGLSNDGKGKFILSPNPVGQKLSYERAYKKADCDPKDVAYIECHATGTPLGDVTELESLDSFFGPLGHKPLVGSVKSNFGHMLTAAGMGSMLKMIMSMKAGQIPATIHVKEPLRSQNGVIDGDSIVNETITWPKKGHLGAVNAFGFGGTNAHAIFSLNTKEKRKDGETYKTKPLAIIGLEATFAGATNTAEFEDAIYKGKDLKVAAPETRWQGLGEAPIGGYQESLDFDFFKYKIPPNEQDPLLPQQLLLLKVADRAIQDAGLKEGSNTAVIVAMETDPTLHRFRGRIELAWRIEKALEDQGTPLDAEEKTALKKSLMDSLHNSVGVNQFTSFIGNIMACRVSSLWDFSGPSLTISAEENSTAKAIEVAQLWLSRGEVESVVIGAVDLSGSFEQFEITKENVKNLSFIDEHLSLGDGAGAIVLQEAEKAEKESAQIYAKINEISPIEDTLDVSGIDYVEFSGHGSAPTFTGDKLSLTAGSASSNVGHSMAAGQMSGLVKLALMIKKGFLPPALNPPKDAPENFFFDHSARPWLNFDSRKASLIHLGEGACRIDLEAGTGLSDKPNAGIKAGPYLFCLRGDLKVELTNLKAEATKNTPLFDLAKSCYYGTRKNKGKSIVLVAGNQSDLIYEIDQALQAFDMGRDFSSPKGSCYFEKPVQGKLTFVYPGGFNSYPGLHRDLLYKFPELWNLPQSYTSDPANLFRSDLIFPKTAQPMSEEEERSYLKSLAPQAVAMFETGINSSILLTALFRSLFQLEPETALGYSMGEVSMTFALGGWESTDEMTKYLKDEPVFKQRLAGEMGVAQEAWGQHKVNWKGYSVQATADEINTKIQNLEKVHLLIINSPTEVVLGGDGEALDDFLAKEKFEFRAIPLHDIIHCDLVKPEYEQLKKLHTTAIPNPPNVEFYTAAGYKKTEITSEQIATNIADMYITTLDFPKLVNNAYDGGSRIFLELGPRMSCSKWIDQILGSKEHLSIGVNQKGQDDFKGISKALSQIWALGYDLELQAIFGPEEMAAKTSRSFVQKVLIGGHKMETPTVKAAVKAPVPVAAKVVAPVVKAPSPVVQKVPAVVKAPAPVSKSVVPKAPAPVAAKVVTPKGPSTPKTNTHPMTTKTPMTSVSPVTTNPNMSQMNALDALFDLHQGIHRNHSAFLEFRRASMEELTGLIQLNQALAGNNSPMLPSSGQAYSQPVANQQPAYAAPVTANVTTPDVIAPKKSPSQLAYPPVAHAGPKVDCIWDEADLMEFACGKIENVFGPEYAVIDTYGPRVRLPMPPYLLANRVTALNATRGEFKPSSIVTEYDVPENAWFCVDGQIPWAIAVEAGQCDLMLISYLGIDFEAQGEYLYRLLDCTLTFKGEMPKVGDRMRYEIQINSFAKQDKNLLFFFEYKCFVGDELVHTMTDGCAGFFNEEGLSKGKGVIRTNKEIKFRASVQKASFAPLIQNSKTSFSDGELLSLCRGQIPRCMGAQYEQGGRNQGLRFSSEEFLMLSRITEVNQTGGLWGLGEVKAVMDLTSDSWFFPCHFKDDSCLAGSLQAEGCVQLLEFYMIYLGLHNGCTDARFRPIHSLPNKVRCRGEVGPGDPRLEYRMEVIEIGLHPRPYAKANVDIILNGKVVVDFQDVGIELIEKAEELAQVAATPVAVATPVADPNRRMDYNDQAIVEFAVGSLGKAFGPDFNIFEGKLSQRNPNGQLQLVSRVPEFNGVQGKFEKESILISEYDVFAMDWYYQDNPAGVLPYSVIMEIALQPCGIIGALMGSPLVFPKTDQRYRNLDATATMYGSPDLRGKIITCKVWLHSTSKAQDTLIQKYSFELLVDGVKFYDGKTTFGYFTQKALSNQLGLDVGKLKPLWIDENNAASTTYNLSDEASCSVFTAKPAQPNLKIGRGQHNYLDQVQVVGSGGKHSKGYVSGSKTIINDDWFFEYHFKDDPVMPGSLGVEAITQAIKTFALDQNLGAKFTNPIFDHAIGQADWKYRGQIVPENDVMSLEAHITSIEETAGATTIWAEASLWKDGLRIYEVPKIGIQIREQ